MTGATGNLDADTRTLQAQFASGGPGEPGLYRVRGPIQYPLKKGPPIILDGMRIEYVEPRPGWDSGFAICSAGYTMPSRPRCEGVEIDFGRTGRLLLPKNGCLRARKGIGITDTDKATVRNARIESSPKTGARDQVLFALQVHNSSDVLIEGGLLAIRSGLQGADGIHGTGTCRRVTVRGLETLSGDDGTSLTHEMAGFQNAVLEDWLFENCSINNDAHSAIKGLILPGVGARSVIRKWRYKNCDLKTISGPTGQGAPVWIVNQGGTIEDVSIEGGRLRVVGWTPGKPHGPMIYLRGVDSFSLTGTAIDFYSRILVDAQSCRQLTFKPLRADLLGPVGRQSTPTPLVMLDDCAEHSLNITRLRPSYSGQSIT